MILCANCVLPETFPGIKFNHQGVCNYCSKFSGKALLEESKNKYRLKFENLLKTKQGQGSYDAIMAFSGGKDSTYTLYILKEKYKMNVLALTFDNGFI